MTPQTGLTEADAYSCPNSTAVVSMKPRHKFNRLCTVPSPVTGTLAAPRLALAATVPRRDPTVFPGVNATILHLALILAVCTLCTVVASALPINAAYSSGA